jgi:DNA-binding MarR family transcriptional regulator
MSSLFEKRQSLARAEAKLGLSNLSENEKAIYAFIDNQGLTNRQEIDSHNYFDGISLSTMKRAVNVLIEANIVTVVDSNKDKRVRLLHIT